MWSLRLSADYGKLFAEFLVLTDYYGDYATLWRDICIVICVLDGQLKNHLLLSCSRTCSLLWVCWPKGVVAERPNPPTVVRPQVCFLIVGVRYMRRPALAANVSLCRTMIPQRT
jgi:hypothetical protein